MKPLITVMITSYNYLRFITTAIDSARAQTYPNLEIVVVDNCSTDGTVPTLRARYRDDPRVRIFENERNLGEVLNSNRAFEHAKGEFVMYLSADDWMYPQHLARSHAVFERAPAVDVVYSGAYFANEAGTVYAQRMLEAMFPYDYVDARDELIDMFTVNCPICWPAALFRRSVFLEVGLERANEGIYGTDWELEIRVALAGKRFAYLAQPSIAIRNHPAQLGRLEYEKGPTQLVDHLLICEKFLDHPGMARLRGRELAVVKFFESVYQDALAAGGPDVVPPEIHARVAAVKRAFEERAATYEPARVHEQRVSVILPVFRSPVLAARAIDSVAQQTFPNWEIVLVDAGATPLEYWVDAHPRRERISYVRATRPLEAGGARNLALRMARGEYLAFLGEANAFAPHHLATLADTIARSGARAAAAASKLVLELTDPRFLAIQNLGEVAIYRSAADPPDLSLVADALPLDALLVYRSFQDRIGGFADLPFFDDFEFVIRLERDGSIAFASEATVEIRTGIDLATIGPTLPRYVAMLDAVYNTHAAPHLAAARALHRAAVERAIAGIAASTAINAQGAAELLATLAGRAVPPLLA